MFLCRIDWCCSIIWTSAYMPLALLVLRPEYSGRTKPLPWVSMPWLLVSQSQQALCYWLHRINRSMCSMGTNSTACTISIWRNDNTLFISLAPSERNPPMTGAIPPRGPATQSFDDFFYRQPEQTAEQTVRLPVIWDILTLMWYPCNVLSIDFVLTIK